MPFPEISASVPSALKMRKSTTSPGFVFDRDDEQAVGADARVAFADLAGQVGDVRQARPPHPGR